MSRGGKVALIVIAAVLVVFGGLCGATYFWIDANKGKIKEAAEAQTQAGEAFAAGTDVDGCVEEGLRKADDCGVMAVKCKVKVNLFLDACLKHATPIADFCVGVPRADDVIDSTRWALAECERRGRADDQNCAQVVGAVRLHCQRVRSAARAAH